MGKGKKIIYSSEGVEEASDPSDDLQMGGYETEVYNFFALLERIFQEVVKDLPWEEYQVALMLLAGEEKSKISHHLGVEYYEVLRTRRILSEIVSKKISERINMDVDSKLILSYLEEIKKEKNRIKNIKGKRNDNNNPKKN